MKKNKAMRAAGGLFIATMLTTSIVSGTYAKYVTSDSGSDSARVAKFGVTINTSGSLFSDTYYSKADGNTPSKGSAATITVKSSSNNDGSSDKVVAPGTKNSMGLDFGISGTPEVMVNIDIELKAIENIFLARGYYTDVTVPAVGANEVAKTFAVSGASYYPIVWTLSDGDGAIDGCENVTLEVINSYFEDMEELKNIAPNTALDDFLNDYTLTWAWDFDYDGAGTRDKADTVLGDLAAGNTTVKRFTNIPTTATEKGSNLVDGKDYNLDIDVEFTITVTQVD